MDTRNWKNFLVEIESATDTGRTTVATGFAVAQNLILTARHAVFVDGQLADEIEVRWPYIDPDDWRDAATLAWPKAPQPEEEVLDAVLLQCEFPKQVSVFGRVANDRPRIDLPWASAGFAAAGAYADGRGISISGTTLASADKEDLVLHSRVAVKTDDDWRGASGSPVFVSGTWDIIGVVVTCEPKLRSEVLTATPAWKLLRDEAFRDLVGQRDAEARRERLARARKRVATRLRASAPARRSLQDHCAAADAAQNEVDGLVAALCQQPTPSLVAILKEAHRDLIDDNERTAAAVISEIACHMVPLAFEAVDVEALRANCGSAGEAVVTVRVANVTVAEFVMARLDARAAAFRPRAEGEKWMKGVNEAFGVTEPGLFDQPTRMLANWRSSTQKEFLDAAEIAELAEGDRTRVVAKRMRLEARDGKTRYCVVNIPPAKFEASDWPQTIATIKQEYPDVIFMRLDRSLDVIDRDDELFYRFLDVLADAGGKGT